MRTQVFAHKGRVGILSSTKFEGLLNDPIKPGQLGFVVDASFVDFSQEAINLLKSVPLSRDDIGDVDIYKDDKDRVIFSWLGGPMRSFVPSKITASNDYHPELLSASDNVVVPEDFIKYVEGLPNL